MEVAAAALASTGTELSSVALSGRPYHGTNLPEISVVEGIDYADSSDAIQPGEIVDRLEGAAIEALGGTPDVWHVHNHSLGKNPAFTEAVHLLAERGHGILLHIHDFAEDGRPDNYFALRNALSDLSKAYPFSPKVRYAVLNRRDAGFLVDAGLPTDQLTLLPNPVLEARAGNEKKPPANELPANLVLCPVRAVRRKNLGELALLAAAHPDLTFANTLGPTNPSYGPAFKRWKDFAAHLQLPIRYAISEESGHSFSSLVETARILVTTSVAEGFGLAFLESWNQGKTLTGRSLPEITTDFRQAGLDLDHLYERLDFPVELIDSDNLRSQLSETLDTLFAAYGKPSPEDGVERSLDTMVQNNFIDFGRLDEPLQETLLRSIVNSPEIAGEIRRQANLVPRSSEVDESNAAAVAQGYGTSAYGQNLLSVYREIASSDTGPQGYIDANALLDAFLKPERLFLLRT